MSSDSRISQFGARMHSARAVKLSFLKNHRDLKNNFFFSKNLHKPSLYIKEQLQQKKFEIKVYLIFFSLQKWPKCVLILKIVLKICFDSFSLFVHLSKLKNKFCFRCNLIKTKCNFLFLKSLHPTVCVPAPPPGYFLKSDG